MKLTGILGAIVLMASTLAFAGDGHDHGEASASAAGPAAPRFTTASEAFELVGVVEGKRMALYLSHYGDSSPVKDARLEIELGGVKIPVEVHAEGQFEAELATAPKAGVIPVTATIYAGEESDLLAGELDVHDESAVAVTAHTSLRDYTTWGIALALILLLAAVGIRRLGAVRNANDPHHGGAA